MLNPGETTEVQGSGSKPYIIKNHDGKVWSCTCPAWRNSGGAVDKKTCKHIRKVAGDAAEAARIGATSPAPKANPTTPAASDAAPDSERDRILARAASQGRKLRQDEKAKLNGPPVMLANSFEEEGDLDPTGWWVSEKYDGVRAYWNGTDFISRQGNIFHAPDWFKAGLPDHPLDGELWMGRGMFQKTLSIVRSEDAGQRWEEITYVVFDHPSHGGAIEERFAFIEALTYGARARAVVHSKVESREQLMAELESVVAQKGEGLMIQKPGSSYEPGRGSVILKLKPFKDSEAVVIGHKPGKGKHKGVLGALTVKMPDGKTFDVGSGLKDSDRRNPPKLGATITYRYTELTDGGIPKCGSFVAVRDYE